MRSAHRAHIFTAIAQDRPGGAKVAVLTRPKAQVNQAQRRARAVETWRNAELVVSARWKDFLAADSETRPGAFAAYVIALDAEAAAADILAAEHLEAA
jgi:hypothetical protein